MAEQKSCCIPQHQKRNVAGQNGEHDGTSVEFAATFSAFALEDSKLIEIPGGVGYVGTDEPIFSLDEESPYRRVKLRPFRIDQCAVTNARFAQFVKETKYKTEAERLNNSFVFYGLLEDQTIRGNAVAAAPWWRMITGACWYRPNGIGSDISLIPHHPVVHVSWNDAQAFARWAGGRLPTEAEWEHAARGGLGDVRYTWGDKAPDEEHFFPCNIWQGQFPTMNSEADGYFGTAPVRSYDPNGYGLFNMVGNVWEWTNQNYIVRSLKKSIRQLQKDRRGFKVCKGGSYLCHASYCHRYRIAARTSNSPDSSTGHIGFRLVYDNN